jgi:excisionase family DNA binding protein
VTGPRRDEPTREILTVEEAAALLGISTKTFAKVLREGDIPGRKIGREWKFARQALIDWVGKSHAREFLGRGEDDGVTEHDAAAGASASFPQRRGRVPGRGRRRGDADMSIEED